MVKNIIFSLSVLIISFIITDFVYSKYKNSKLIDVIEFNKDFEYNFKQNISSKTKFGPFLVDICTNDAGMRVSCKNENNLKKYDLAIIGDSFIEGVGLNYENTIGGLIENKAKIEVANLGVRSYSPANYLKKISSFIESGYEFDHIIIFIDISDIPDEYMRSGKVRNSFSNFKISEKIDLYIYLTSNLQMTYFLYFNIKSYFRNNFGLQKKEQIFSKFDAYDKNYDRGSWTYDDKNKYKLKGLDYSTQNMKILANFLNSKNISYSLAVYPWPQQLLYDTENSIQVVHWKKFCQNSKCKNFYNFFHDFFKLSKEKGTNKVLLDYYFFTDIHFNKNGNNVITERIIKDIK